MNVRSDFPSTPCYCKRTFAGRAANQVRGAKGEHHVEIKTGRPPTLASSGMVTCSHSLASQAGVDVLRAGGSAVDAAIATSAALSVIYPHMTGVGGDAFWLIYDAERDVVRYLEGGGRAAGSADIEWFRERGHTEIPFRGVLPATITTPGGVASWCEAHAAYGRLPMRRNLEAAIGYAGDGFPVTARLARWIGETAPSLRSIPSRRRSFSKAAPHHVQGLKLSNVDLARTLDAIASSGWSGFYEGEVAREMARFARERGGFFTERDFQVQRASWGEPLRGAYRGVTPVRNTGAHAGVHGAGDAQSRGCVRVAQHAIPRSPIMCTFWYKPSKSPITIATGGLPILRSPTCRWNGCCHRLMRASAES
jgi:gamma-glutamyltranspeptidase